MSPYESAATKQEKRRRHKQEVRRSGAYEIVVLFSWSPAINS
jgi:hypothetical protein